MYVIQHSDICRPSDSTVSEDAGIEPRAVATFALTARRSNHSARSHENCIGHYHNHKNGYDTYRRPTLPVCKF
jgi:hypothetical protein